MDVVDVAAPTVVPAAGAVDESGRVELSRQSLIRAVSNCPQPSLKTTHIMIEG